MEKIRDEKAARAEAENRTTKAEKNLQFHFKTMETKKQAYGHVVEKLKDALAQAKTLAEHQCSSKCQKMQEACNAALRTSSDRFKAKLQEATKERDNKTRDFLCSFGA